MRKGGEWSVDPGNDFYHHGSSSAPQESRRANSGKPMGNILGTGIHRYRSRHHY